MINKIRLCVRNPDVGLLIFRLCIGLTMAFSHGLGKIPPMQQLVDGVGAMGFPFPIFFAWVVALTEFVGALFIAAGLFTRISALFLAVTMAVAFFIVHGADPFNVKELAFLFLASSVLLIFTGAGKYGLDRFVCKKWE